ncbi:MAG: hypothetical protein FGM62_09580 [Methylobacterium sp.]|nr:hypothetical protein [Methylobacterium sp.]
MASKWINTYLLAGLVLAMLLTRGSHFGNSFLLPDASLAVFFLGGMLLGRHRAFIGLLAVAFLVDIWAINFQNVPAYCFTPAYVGLLPTYGLVWLSGVWLSRRAAPFAAKAYFLTAAASTLLAFVISNAFFYGFSGHFMTMQASDFANAVAQYLPAYAGFTLLYLGVAWLGRLLWKFINRQEQALNY